MYLVAGWAAEEIAKDRVARGDRLRDQLLRTCVENGQTRIEREEDSTIPAGNDHILVAVRRANRLHVLLNLGPQGSIARSLQPSANGGAKECPPGMHAGIAHPLASPVGDLAGLQLGDGFQLALFLASDGLCLVAVEPVPAGRHRQGGHAEQADQGPFPNAVACSLVHRRASRDPPAS